MLWQAFCASALLAFGVSADLYSDLSILNNPGPWAWDEPRFEARSSSQKDREPLAPDYKDPDPSATEQKPVLNPKESKEKHPVNPVPLGGVIDVDANGGFPSFSSPFGPEFDFPGLGSRPSVLGFGSIFGIDAGRQWWKGKNVCIEREESTDDDDEEEGKEREDKKNNTEVSTRQPNFFQTSLHISNCFEAENKYECTTKIDNHGVVKTFTVRYKCCYGFKRLPDSNGCTKQVDLKPVLQTLEDLKLTEFRGLIKSSGLDATFQEGNYTIFVPSDDAMNDYNEKINEVNNVDLARRRRALKTTLSSRDLVLSHVTDGFVELADLSNEETLQSQDEQNSSIRLNMYPTHTYEKMLTVNCARIKKGNILADNGVVHIVDKVMAPASSDLLKIIQEHPKLTSLRKVLENTDIPSRLKPNGHYTIFAPTDDAFNKLDEPQRQKLLNGGGCASNILKHHFVAHTVCSSAIIGNATTHNVEGVELNMERTVDDEMIFEGKAKIVEPDVIATNGVLHLIDSVIIPESGQYIGNVLKAHNFSKFQQLVEKAGLTDELNNLNNATVFVPLDQAFEHPQAEKILTDIGDDQQKLQELVRYHAVQGQMQSCNMKNNLRLPTLDSGKEIRVNLYSMLPLFTNIVNRATINCAKLLAFDEMTCGSTVHEVNRVLIPPTKNILEFINADDKYSTVKKLLQGSEVEKILQENNRSITFLVPTDEAFAALDEDDRKNLDDKEKAEELLKSHILTEVLCCSGVGPHTWGFNSFVPTLGSQKIEVGRTGSQVRFNRAVAIGCDNLATNGVVHMINKVLIPRKPAMAALGGGFFLFDL